MINMTMMTSMNTYTRNMKMQMKWQQRKTSGNYAGGDPDKKISSESLRTDRPTDASDLLKTLNTSSVSREQIDAKMRSGKRLSAAEMEYLKENDPQTYQKAKAIEMEREAYERELKQCKTKEEVQRVKLSHAAASMASVKNIETDPHIPEGAKLGLMMQELAKTNALSDVEQQFVKSGDYQALPSEEERRRAEKDLKEAEEAEKGIEDRTDDTPEEATDAVNEKAAKEAVEEKSSLEEKTPSKAEIKAAKEAVSGRKISRMEAEVTPEARKVRRAKAQAAYAQSSFTGSSSSTIDVKAE